MKIKKKIEKAFVYLKLQEDGWFVFESKNIKKISDKIVGELGRQLSSKDIPLIAASNTVKINITEEMVDGIIYSNDGDLQIKLAEEKKVV